VCLYFRHFLNDIFFFTTGINASANSSSSSPSCMIYSSSAALTLGCSCGFLYMKTQNPIQIKPKAPIIMKDISQPQYAAITGTISGAAKAPTVAPALKILVDNALSFFGKYSAVALIAAGKFPASPTAKTKRAKMNNVTLTLTTNPTSFTREIASLAPSNPTNHSPATMPEVAIPQKACSTAPTDHIPIAHKKPFFVSSQSTKGPANNILTA